MELGSASQSEHDKEAWDSDVEETESEAPVLVEAGGPRRVECLLGHGRYIPLLQVRGQHDAWEWCLAVTPGSNLSCTVLHCCSALCHAHDRRGEARPSAVSEARIGIE